MWRSEEWAGEKYKAAEKKRIKKISERLNSVLASLQPYGNWRDVKKVLRQDAQDKGGKFSLLLSGD